jgi:hypothetical protein
VITIWKAVITLPTIATAIVWLFYALKGDRKTIAIAGRAITLDRKPSKKKQRNDTKKDAKRIKSECTRSNREKSNIAIAILET